MTPAPQFQFTGDRLTRRHNYKSPYAGWLQLVQDEPDPEPTLPDIGVYVAGGKNYRGLVTFHGFDSEPVGLWKDGTPIKTPFRLTDLAGLFERNQQRDVHLVTYVVEDEDGNGPERIPRLTKQSIDQVRAAGWNVVHRTIFVDQDLKDLVGRSGTIEPPKLRWDELTETERARVEAQIVVARDRLKAKGMPWIADYRTRAGLRFIHALSLAVPAGDGYEALVGRFLNAHEAAGLKPDRACEDWTRLFRAPRVTLEDGIETWDQDWTKQTIANHDGDESYFYTPKEADLVPPRVALNVQIERTATREMPDPMTAQALVEFYDDNGRKMRQTAPGKAAKRAFKDSGVYPWIYDRIPLAFPGKRHEMLTRAVGEVVGTLHGMPGVSPEFVFGLLYEPAGRLGEDEDWTGKLWEMATSFWDKEELKKAQKAVLVAQVTAEAKDPKPQDAEQVPRVLVEPEPRDTFEHLLGRMKAQNTVRPQFFATLDGKLAHVRGDRIEELSGPALASFLALNFRYFKITNDGKGNLSEVFGACPRELAPIVQGYADFGKHLPIVETVLTVPMLNLETGESFADGYDKDSRTLVVPMSGLRYEPHDDPVAALEFLRHNLLHDFPFASDADRTNALAAILTHATATSWGNHSTPIFLMDAPKVSNGKTLLARVCAMLAGVDDPLTAVSQNSTSGELDKAATTAMRAGRPVVVFDNLEGKVSSPTIAALATAGRTARLRRLATNDELTVRANIAKDFTGNNLSFNADINRRVVRIRIDAKDPHPDRRDPNDFLHPDLLAWVREHRGELLAAAHTVVRAWIRAGRPDYGVTSFGSFERWSFVIGNALRHAGVEDFLGNRDEQATDDDADTLRMVLAQLAERFPDREFAAKDAVVLVRPLLGDEHAKDATALGDWLKSKKDNRVLLDDGRQVWLENGGKNKHGVRWQVKTKPAG